MREEKPFSFNDALSGIPVQHQVAFQEAVRGWQDGIDFVLDGFVMNLEDKRILETFSPKNLESVDLLLTHLIFQNQLRIRPEIYPEQLLEIHNHLLVFADLFIRACKKKNHIPSVGFVNIFFNGVRFFTTTGNHGFFANMNFTAYLYYFKLNDFVESSLFSDFLKKEAKTSIDSKGMISAVEGFDVKRLAQDCIADLTGYLHTRRTTLFLQRLRFTLSFFKRAPYISGEFMALPEIITWFRRLCDFGDKTFLFYGASKSEKIDLVKNLLSDCQNELPQGWGNALMEAYSRGEADDGTANSSEIVLNVEWVYTELLKEIAGDGVLSSSEEEVIRNMRNYLEISNDSYQRIFNKVTQLPKSTDRDFDPCVFFKSIVKIAMADGILEDDEKALLATTANALSVDREVVMKIFQEVVNMPKEQNEFAQSTSESYIPEDLKASWINSMKLKKAIKSDPSGAKITEDSQNTLDKPGAWLSLLENSEEFEYPVFIHLVSDLNRDEYRKQYKGGTISLSWNHTQQSHMIVNNRSIVSEMFASFPAGTDESSLKTRISSALQKADDKYGIALLSFPSCSTLFFTSVDSGIDLTGELDRLNFMLNQGAFPEISELDNLVNSQKGIAEAVRTRGLTRMHLAKAHIKSGEENEAAALLNDAAKDFESMISKWPSFPEGYVGLAMVNRTECDGLGKEEKMAEAIKHLEKAVEINPANISTRITYAFYGSLLWADDPARLIEFEKQQLGFLFGFQPDAQQLVGLFNQFRERFQVEFRNLAALESVDVVFQ